jgi:hypothetical protein
LTSAERDGEAVVQGYRGPRLKLFDAREVEIE